jgi:preflagellin peptidase FlaK
MIELAKVLLCLPFLLYSCYSDIKSRRVSNNLWLIMLAVFLPLILYELIHYGLTYLMWMGISFAVIFVFTYVLFYFGALGGADAKALMLLSLIFPFYPTLVIGGYSFPVEGVPLINLFTFTLFGNSVLLTIIVPLGLFLYNLTRPGLGETLKDPLFMFIGYRCDIDRLEEKKHVKLIRHFEEVGGKLTGKFRGGGSKIDDEMLALLRSHAGKGDIGNKVWVTPGLPFMVPITAGFLTTVFYGDLIFRITLLFMG